ncbi:hypothetical protein ACFWUZ_35655 [Streptomyces sp. NPDC058646]|uniref:hypothetical protein n=1 Tax=Streptomyces sp. NPDC058646 TaxID=3346574 RepID=UPI0036616282
MRRGSELVDPVLREVVDRLQPSMATVCRYHLGWDIDGSQAAVQQAVKRSARRSR